MATELPQVFRKSSGFNLTFDWIDATTGSGYIRFYACQAEDGTSTKKILTTKQIDANPPTIENSPGNVNYTILWDDDYDTTFAIPAIIEGTAYLNVTHYIEQDAGYGYFVINVYHVRGVTETSIGTLTGAERSPTASTDPESIRECLKITLTEKVFAVGDILRLNIQYYCKGSGAFRTYFDPTTAITLTDKYSRTIGTDVTFDVPFKVET